MTEKLQAKVLFRVVQVTAPGERIPSSLFVQLRIDCDDCGTTEGTLTGHHLRTVHKALGMIIEANPELCGDVGEIVGQVHFGGMTPTGGKEILN